MWQSALMRSSLAVTLAGSVIAASNKKSELTSDVVIIGGGVVGLAVARELAVRNYSVNVLEATDAIASGASSGNSGIGCTGYDAPAGSLERSLLRRSIHRHPHLYRSLGLSYEHVRKSGALVLAWSEEQLSKLPQILDENLEAGDLESCLLTKEEVMEQEPCLPAERVHGALWAPREMVTEPWLVPIAYAHSALLHGARLLTNQKVTDAHYDGDMWMLRTASGGTFRTKTVINCAGLFGDQIEAICMGSESAADFKIAPRKGQFVVFNNNGGVDVDAVIRRKNDSHKFPTSVLQPVPTQYTKGVIVWRTVYGNMICGPTAEEQTSRVDRSNDDATIHRLTEYAHDIVPALQSVKSVGTYSGIRPATQHRDYQIRSDAKHHYITVGGIRSTGLTAASGIAEYVAALHADLLQGKSHPIGTPASDVLPVLAEEVLPPYLPSTVLDPAPRYNNPRAPSLQSLADDYVTRGDGQVTCFGRLWTVTHPISQFGMQSIGRDKRWGGPGC